MGKWKNIARALFGQQNPSVGSKGFRDAENGFRKQKYCDEIGGKMCDEKKKKQVVKFFLVFIAGCATSSCGAVKKDTGALVKHNPERNCIKYTLNYATDNRNIERTLDTLFVWGTTRVCATNTVMPFVEIIVLDDDASTETKTISDRKGQFSFKLRHGFYSITADAPTAQLEIPVTYLGHDGNVLNMDLYLATHEVLINEMDDPKLRKEIEELKKQR